MSDPRRVVSNLSRHVHLMGAEVRKIERDQSSLVEAAKAITTLVSLTDNIISAIELGSDYEDHIDRYLEYRGKWES